jgi:hypothetical protein
MKEVIFYVQEKEIKTARNNSVDLLDLGENIYHVSFRHIKIQKFKIYCLTTANKGGCGGSTVRAPGCI